MSYYYFKLEQSSYLIPNIVGSCQQWSGDLVELMIKTSLVLLPVRLLWKSYYLDERLSADKLTILVNLYINNTNVNSTSIQIEHWPSG